MPKSPEEKRAYLKAYYEKNKGKWKPRTQEQRDRYNAKRRHQYASDPAVREKAKAETKAWQEANPRKRKDQRLRSTFGIAIEDFEERLAIQNGQCAICGHTDRSDPKFFPVVDHCHKTGRVRGLLCVNCNHGLGKFKDDAGRLLSAVSYLHRNGSSGAT